MSKQSILDTIRFTFSLSFESQKITTEGESPFPSLKGALCNQSIIKMSDSISWEAIKQSVLVTKSPPIYDALPLPSNVGQNQ